MKAFLIFILTSALIGYASLYLFNKYSTIPNQQTQAVAQNINKFPQSTSWQIKNSKNICTPGTNPCSQPTNIIFESQERWDDIYSFYNSQMQKSGWVTNSKILTSIPSSIVFTNSASCKAELSSYKPISNAIQKPQNNQYIFAVTCP